MDCPLSEWVEIREKKRERETDKQEKKEKEGRMTLQVKIYLRCCIACCWKEKDHWIGWMTQVLKRRKKHLWRGKRCVEINKTKDWIVCVKESLKLRLKVHLSIQMIKFVCMCAMDGQRLYKHTHTDTQTNRIQSIHWMKAKGRWAQVMGIRPRVSSF